jgi:hypothetical protein
VGLISKYLNVKSLGVYELAGVSTEHWYLLDGHKLIWNNEYVIKEYRDWGYLSFKRLSFGLILF